MFVSRRPIGLLLIRLALWAACCILSSAFPAGCGGESGGTEVIINRRRWRVELATTARRRYQGLAGRRSLGPDEGMLFVFPDSKVRRFCMRGCLIPLDIAFIGPDLRVVKIDTMLIEPDGAGRTIYGSEAPAQYALEVAAGQLGSAGIGEGDKVSFRGKIPAPAKAAPGP